MKKIAGTLVIFALMGWTLGAQASTILGGPTGLVNPDVEITFDELGNLQDQAITDQFAHLGVTFENIGWDNATYGQAGSTGFAGGDLVNGLGPFPTGDVLISFASPVYAATFAAVDQNSTWTVDAFLGGTGGTLVDTFDLLIPSNPGAGFIGFENIRFDTIRISGTEAITIDTLSYSIESVAVPAMDTLGLLMLALLLAATGWVGVRRI